MNSFFFVDFTLLKADESDFPKVYFQVITVEASWAPNSLRRILLDITRRLFEEGTSSLNYTNSSNNATWAGLLNRRSSLEVTALGSNFARNCQTLLFCRLVPVTTSLLFQLNDFESCKSFKDLLLSVNEADDNKRSL